ncbi:MAG: hypothetical protein K2Q01_02875 [Rickettsiales bacterium]|nr:hypothetical protein [Rickettsiales bacterium]
MSTLLGATEATPHFAGVMQRFHLLSRADVISEQTTFVGRVDGDRGTGSAKPFG